MITQVMGNTEERVIFVGVLQPSREAEVLPMNLHAYFRELEEVRKTDHKLFNKFKQRYSLRDITGIYFIEAERRMKEWYQAIKMSEKRYKKARAQSIDQAQLRIA